MISKRRSRVLVSPFLSKKSSDARADTMRSLLAVFASLGISTVSALRGSWMIENSSMSLQLHLIVIPWARMRVARRSTVSSRSV